MKRVVSVWLPQWPIDRMRIADKRSGRTGGPPTDEKQPFALTLSGTHGLELYALNCGARAEGLARRMTLADARVRLGALRVRSAEPQADKKALERLAHWAMRFSPLIAVDGLDGLLLETSGIAHLFGGEEKLLETIETSLAALGIAARGAIAPTIGAAWALARFSPARERWARIAEPADLRGKLAALPAAALRLEERTALTLKRFGLTTIGALYGLPRASLARRFQSLETSEHVLARLDQALGHANEPLSSLAPPPAYRARLSSPEPLSTTAAIEAGLLHLLKALNKDLEIADEGARALTLALFRTDGEVIELTVRTSLPSRTSAHFLRLFKEHMDDIDPGFGIDLLILSAGDTQTLSPDQASLTRESSADGNNEALSELIDRLASRLGAEAVMRPAPQESHIPERAEVLVPVLDAGQGFSATANRPENEAQRPSRPFRLFDSPEPITVMAEVPDGPPLRFTWRRRMHEVTRARGPERISPEWWRADLSAGPMRDYYEIEDRQGRRFWVYRAGLYEETENRGPPKWYVHGLYG